MGLWCSGAPVIASVMACFALAACGPVPQIVPLVKEGGASSAYAAGTWAPLEIVTRSTAISDPLPLRGTAYAYTELEEALGLSVIAATTPWATRHADDETARKGGWTLLVELTSADAEVTTGGRVVIGIDVRATLRVRSGNTYLGQTQAGCREGGLVPAEQGSQVIARCLTQVGRDLAGWLAGGVRLGPPLEGP